MRAYEIHEWGGLIEVKKPLQALLAHEVRVEIKAVSLNYRDWMILNGEYNPHQPLPLIPCSDMAGVVVEVGPFVTKWQVGDRVCGLFAQSWMCGPQDLSVLKHTLGSPLPGVLSEFRVFPETGLIQVPKHLSLEEASTLPCAALTAYHALVGHQKVAPGDVVVTQGTGGVSLFALQLAKALGAQVIALFSTAPKGEFLKQLGADVCISYLEKPKWSEAVREATGGQGANHIVEVVGGSSFEQSLRAAAHAGQVSVIGTLGGGALDIPLRFILMKSLRVQGIFVGNASLFQNMIGYFENKQLRPVLGPVYSFLEAKKAFLCMKNKEHMGKIVIQIP